MDYHEGVFLSLCERALGETRREDIDSDDAINRAINHPVGHIAEALIDFWFKKEPNDGERLQPQVEPLFTRLCDTTVTSFRHGRVLLTSHLVALFRVDRSWTEKQLLPLFDWKEDALEARAAWEGFLWSPRLYGPLMAAFKDQFLDTAHHYKDLGTQASRFIALLTYAALEPMDGYTESEFQAVLLALPQDALEESAESLIHALDGAGEQAGEYWTNRVEPFWKAIWPKSREVASKGLAERLARLAIASSGSFPVALTTVLDWLQPIEHPELVVHQLDEANLSARFPAEVLTLLSTIIGDRSRLPDELQRCLDAISQAAPDLVQDQRHRILVERLRRHSRHDGG